MVRVEVVSVPADRHGEGPVWLDTENALVWVDVFEEPSIQRFEPATGTFESWPMPAPITCLAPRRHGGFVAGMEGGFHFIAASGAVEFVADPTSAERLEILGDGKCDPAGRFWCASLDRELKTPLAKLYRLDPDHHWAEMDRGFITGNGVAFAPDGDRLYVADSRSEIVWAYDFDVATGTIAAKRPFFSTSDMVGRVDGATIDSEGNYWCALIQGWAILAIDPRGELVERIELPVESPTMCIFGDVGRDTLYVTTSAQRMNEEMRRDQPLAGSLLAVEGLGVRGLPVMAFAG